MKQMSVEDIKNLIERLKGLELIILAGQDYANFCMLILYGSLMATHLIHLKKISKKALKHAHDWRQIAQTFIPLLQEQIKVTKNTV